MNNKETIKSEEVKTTKKESFLKRMINKLDDAMKKKSEAKSSCCCSNGDEKGDKCC